MHLAIQIVAIILMIGGVILALFPVVPGILIIYATMIIYGLIEGFHQTSFWFLMVMLVLVIISYLIDNLAAWWGARKYGASRVGAWGAVIGGFVGVIIQPLLGLILGPVLGAIIAELLISRRSLQEAWQVGVGTFLGFLGGSLARFVIALSMVVSFIYRIF